MYCEDIWKYIQICIPGKERDTRLRLRLRGDDKRTKDAGKDAGDPYFCVETRAWALLGEGVKREICAGLGSGPSALSASAAAGVPHGEEASTEKQHGSVAEDERRNNRLRQMVCGRWKKRARHCIWKHERGPRMCGVPHVNYLLREVGRFLRL